MSLLVDLRCGGARVVDETVIVSGGGGRIFRRVFNRGIKVAAMDCPKRSIARSWTVLATPAWKVGCSCRKEATATTVSDALLRTIGENVIPVNIARWASLNDTTTQYTCFRVYNPYSFIHCISINSPRNRWLRSLSTMRLTCWTNVDTAEAKSR